MTYEAPPILAQTCLFDKGIDFEERPDDFWRVLIEALESTGEIGTNDWAKLMMTSKALYAHLSRGTVVVLQNFLANIDSFLTVMFGWSL